MGFAVYAESPLLQAYLADAAQPQIRDTAFGLYFALAFGVGSNWSGILGWITAEYRFFKLDSIAHQRKRGETVPFLDAVKVSLLVATKQ